MCMFEDGKTIIIKKCINTFHVHSWSHYKETGNRKQEIFIRPKDNKTEYSTQNHTIYYIYVDMIKRSSKSIEYGLKNKR